MRKMLLSPEFFRAKVGRKFWRFSITCITLFVLYFLSLLSKGCLLCRYNHFLHEGELSGYFIAALSPCFETRNEVKREAIWHDMKMILILMVIKLISTGKVSVFFFRLLLSLSSISYERSLRTCIENEWNNSKLSL